MARRTQDTQRRDEAACPDCSDLSRRDFLKTTAAVAAVGAVAVPLASAPFTSAYADDAKAKTAKGAKSETLVGQLYGSLTEKQKGMVAFAYDHPLRGEVDNNWHITKARIAKDFNADQQALIREIFNSLHSDEYAERVMKQVEHDNGRGGFGGCTIALFGNPGSGKFEFVFTGRHVTRRCDGDTQSGTGFGGPIFYGHAAKGFNESADHPGNIYWYQAKRANELFQALDGKQRKLALRDDPRDEEATDTVKLAGPNAKIHGVPFGDLSADQKGLARKVMTDVLAPFRKTDVRECMKLIESQGFDNLHMAYYKNLDIGNDKVWDVWQVEGPEMVWYFRGAPHVHTWVHVRGSA